MPSRPTAEQQSSGCLLSSLNPGSDWLLLFGFGVQHQLASSSPRSNFRARVVSTSDYKHFCLKAVSAEQPSEGTVLQVKAGPMSDIGNPGARSRTCSNPILNTIKPHCLIYPTKRCSSRAGIRFGSGGDDRSGRMGFLSGAGNTTGFDCSGVNA